MARNTLLMAVNATPFFVIVDSITEKMSTPPVAATNNATAVAFNADSTKAVVTFTGAPYFHVYTVSDWSKLANPGFIPPGGCYACDFSYDGTKLAIGFSGAPYLSVYNTSDWTKSSPSAAPTGTVFGVSYSPDGTKLAVSHTNTPFITLYNTSDMSKIANPATLPASNSACCDFSPDGTKLAVGHTNSPFITLYNVSDWSKLANPSSLLPASPTCCAFSPDGTKLAIGHTSAPFYTIYNVSDLTKLTLSSLPMKLTIAAVKSVIWRNNDICIMSTDGCPGVVELDVITGTFVRQIDAVSNVLGVALSVGPGWKIDGTISESLAASSWIASAYDYDTGTFLNSSTFTGTTFSVDLSTPSPVTLTVAANQGSQWQASKSTALNALAYPTNPANTPYYYQATAGGLTASSEPVWPITVGGTVVDGTVTWTRVERLIQPITQAPLIPVPV
ncbi:WD40 repeat domain-containing protein [Methylobacter sp. G7]|uniref:WD40 repeat domain-containing protein n=1 Tax=Methylobacter sp. G7 TaxID=3230117 RepID=UPI003D806968